jgi:Asp/Glu/hydantoin racemase
MLKKKLGCLHAHFSNIEYIEAALSTYDIELTHFVDPGLMKRVTNDNTFTESAAEKKVIEQVEWIAQSGVDAILITCTNYIALLNKEQLHTNVPIILMDEPYFEAICQIQQPQTILFTNPATVEGTMNRLEQYAKIHQKTLDIEVVVIENTFELIMRGQKEEYEREVSLALKNQIQNQQRVVSVAQLSMVAAAQQVERQTSKNIIHPLNTLVPSIMRQLKQWP